MVIYSTILGAIIGSGVLTAPALGAPAALTPASVPAAAGARLGGIDMNRACRDQYGMGYPAGTIGNSCNDWQCILYNTNFGDLYYPVDTPAACKRQYGNNVYAWCQGGWDKWSCYRT
ncbi:hypothetical protein AA0113_g6698 [Alternaria arborescens]|uniref:Secreted protein n=1 Tax=Alternaria arborescens TaxID=156630 RepID=A0A4Q4RWR4_9PLEO|nr:hypothetical protein AA0111_g3038 [Alternaria arborescens]RYN42462.1 hypothetical protein AA0112_g1283 [Alternaria arborescens]RYO36419.1 hypothetical protein AA0111_g3038 [Alternaria arborescens]RYO61721.1 hypothetical protein AA0113_g6698 [Alternaria arborescens]